MADKISRETFSTSLATDQRCRRRRRRQYRLRNRADVWRLAMLTLLLDFCLKIITCTKTSVLPLLQICFRCNTVNISATGSQNT